MAGMRVSKTWSVNTMQKKSIAMAGVEYIYSDKYGRRQF